MSGNQERESTTGITAARLHQVVFSYDRHEDLPTADGLDGRASRTIDPDERGGPVLQGVDLTIPEGSFTVVMGASGGGKSTLLRTLNGIIPDFITGRFNGEVTVLGRDATTSRVSEMAESVGMVFQDYEAQLFRTSIVAEVAFGPENLAVPPTEIDERVDRTLSLVGLDGLDPATEPAGISGGQKQRLVLASVLAMNPEFLVLDEPTSDLDPQGTRELIEIMRSLTNEPTEGNELSGDEPIADSAVTDDTASSTPEWAPDTVVMVTHKVEEALLADRAVLLQGGRVHREGPTRDVFTDAAALREARVAVPPLVKAFHRLGWPDDDLPLLPAEAARRVRESALEWTPPAGEDSGVPAGTGQDLGDPVFELEDVVFEYETDRGPVRAVDTVDLTIREGEVVGIVGQNGSGKTTLAKHLNGLYDPDSGSVRWHGRSVPDLSMTDIGRHVGYVFQNPDHQIFASTVREEVAFGPRNFGLTGDELDRRIRDAIETVEIDTLVDADPFTLSKGQRQRVALAGILATDPEVIVFDEPTTGLDATQQEQFLDLVARLNRDNQLTIVMVTHDMETIARYAPRTIVLEDGQKAYDGPSRELFADSDRLEGYGLQPPHVVELSNQLAENAEMEGLPALSVDELVTGLGGSDAYEHGRHAGSVSDGDDT